MRTILASSLLLVVPLCACSSLEERRALALECVSASWESPRATDEGSVLPWLRIDQTSTGCETSRIAVRAFRDSDEDGEPDTGSPKIVMTATWSGGRDFSEFSELEYEGKGPTRWILEISTAKGDARVDLGWVR